LNKMIHQEFIRDFACFRKIEFNNGIVYTIYTKYNNE